MLTPACPNRRLRPTGESVPKDERWRSPSLSRRCSMKSDAFAQAKTAELLQCWGQILGTGCGTRERCSYAIEAIKKPFGWPFVKPSDGLEPSTPSLPWRIRASATRCGKQRLSGRFPCKPAGSSTRCAPSSKCPERPCKALNLSPKPVPQEIRLRRLRCAAVDDIIRRTQLRASACASLPRGCWR